MSSSEIKNKILGIFGDQVLKVDEISKKEFTVELTKPTYYKLRFYIFNCNNPPGGRPLDEYKIVLNVGQPDGERGNFKFDEYFPIVLGYNATTDVFVLWDCHKHHDFAFNKNMQVKGETIAKASVLSEVIKQERKLRDDSEIVLAVSSLNLLKAVEERVSLYK